MSQKKKANTALVLHSDTPAGLAAVKAAEARDYQVFKAFRSNATNSSSGFPVDSTDLQDVLKFAEQLNAQGIQIDILITCPATVPVEMDNSFFSPFEDMEVEDWDNILSLNLRAPMLFCKVFGQRMRARGDGRIIQMVGNVAIDPHDPRHLQNVEKDREPGRAPAAYCCAMAGVLALTRHLAADYLDSGVLINNLVFGPLKESEPEALAESYVHRIPVGRIMTTEDLTGALDLLLAPGSKYITGQSIIVDGGVGIW